MSRSRHLVVCYDIPHDARRARLAKLLAGYLEHVQKSVFEGPLDDLRDERLRRAIEKVIDRNEDSVRIYWLCPRCREATDVLGLGVLVEEPEGDIVV